MIIERQIARYSVFVDDNLIEALKKIGDNKMGVIFAVSQSGKFEGMMTDGDFRRWVIENPAMDLSQSVLAVITDDCVTVQDGTPIPEIEKLLVGKIKTIPVLDDQNHLVGVAIRRLPELRLGSFVISEDTPTFIIAEIGNNHNGSLDLAKTLIEEAKASGANCAKFQMRQINAIYANQGNPNDVNEDLGAQYVLDLLSKFSLSNEEMIAAFDYCKELGMLPLCTPWDKESLALLENYGMAAYKIGSPDLTNLGLLGDIVATNKPIILSTGMSTETEIRQTVSFLKEEAANFVLLHCNSTYPTPFKDIQLNYMKRLKEIGDCQVGYSGHERGISTPIAAVALGARVIEKHLTLDKKMEGNDHKVSLLPSEFAYMVEGIRAVEAAMGGQERREITQGEMMNREILAKSVVAKTAIKTGDLITRAMVDIRSPGKGMQPNRLGELIGRAATRNMVAGDFFFPSDLSSTVSAARGSYEFGRPWGIPVRYHDYKSLSEKSTPDLFEFHLSYKDMDERLEDHFDQALDQDFVVHSPELFAGDQLLDLCAQDEDDRRHSVAELQRVIDLTRKLKAYFPKTERPIIVTNVGGFSLDRHLDRDERAALEKQFLVSWGELDMDGVEIIPQTMPPFPWHFGGQRYHNLFVDKDNIVSLCRDNDIRVCLDISHSKLACNYEHGSFMEFIGGVGPYTAHMHLADAGGIDGEGLQIGDGEIDFVAFAQTINETAPGASFIPEIWQGHKNGGEGFWYALDKLEECFAKANLGNRE
jgi:sialic acid synthase SpsE/sugar phosphate isomerase/epimerase